MLEQANILISVRGKFVDGMLSGTKKVELRRRPPRIDGAARVWIYNKSPVAAVTAMAVLSAVELLPPDMLWKQYGSVLDLSFGDFSSYVSGKSEVAALCLESVHPVRPVSLDEMRRLDPKFHPPQFYLKLKNRDMLLSMFEDGMA